jgi:hypothetical protein
VRITVAALSRHFQLNLSTVARLSTTWPMRGARRSEFVKVIFRIQIIRYTAHKEYRFK